MKKILISLLLISSICFAKDEVIVSKEAVNSLTTQFQDYIKQKSKEVDGDVMKDFEKLAPLLLDENTDLAFVKNVILILIKLDETDPSRTGVMMLGQSYANNTTLYKKAFASLKTKKNNTQLKEIEDLMKSFSQLGNG
jgi:hypothetical protein